MLNLNLLLQVVLLTITQEKLKVLLEIKYPVNAIYIESPGSSVINFTARPGFYLATSMIEDIYVEILYKEKIVLIIYDRFHCEFVKTT